VVSIVFCIGGGVLLDREFDTTPIFTLIGVALALVVAGYQLFELAQVGRRDRSAGPVTRQVERLALRGKSRGSGQESPPGEDSRR